MSGPDIKIRIREATSKDLNLLIGFINDIAEFEGLSDEVSFNREELHDSLFGISNTAEAIIAENQGDAVGFAVYFQNFSTFKGKPGLYLEDFKGREPFPPPPPCFRPFENKGGEKRFP